MAICLAVGALASGCSSSSSPSPAAGPFPSVLASPVARDTTPLSPDEVKQAMDTLVSERNHLCAEAVATSGAKAYGSSGPGNCTADGTTAGAAGTKP
jgi:hypothetical protein